jgi:hypothetical protein
MDVKGITALSVGPMDFSHFLIRTVGLKSACSYRSS